MIHGSRDTSNSVSKSGRLGRVLPSAVDARPFRADRRDLTYRHLPAPTPDPHMSREEFRKVQRAKDETLPTNSPAVCDGLAELSALTMRAAGRSLREKKDSEGLGFAHASASQSQTSTGADAVHETKICIPRLGSEAAGAMTAAGAEQQDWLHAASDRRKGGEGIIAHDTRRLPTDRMSSSHSCEGSTLLPGVLNATVATAPLSPSPGFRHVLAQRLRGSAMKTKITGDVSPIHSVVVRRPEVDLSDYDCGAHDKSMTKTGKGCTAVRAALDVHGTSAPSSADAVAVASNNQQHAGHNSPAGEEKRDDHNEVRTVSRRGKVRSPGSNQGAGVSTRIC